MMGMFLAGLLLLLFTGATAFGSVILAQRPIGDERGLLFVFVGLAVVLLVIPLASVGYWKGREK